MKQLDGSALSLRNLPSWFSLVDRYKITVGNCKKSFLMTPIFIFGNGGKRHVGLSGKLGLQQ
jgi:hypothetical protein